MFRKCGAQMVPTKPVVLEVEARVHQGLYDYNAKKYICLELGAAAEKRVTEIHQASSHLFAGKVIDPKEGSLLRVKVPFKYNRVSCEIQGLRPLQEYTKGDHVLATIQYCGVWNVNGFSGPSWKLATLGPHP